MVPITSETPYSDANFDTKLQAKFDKPYHFKSKLIDSEVLTITYESPYSKDNFGNTFQSKFATSDQSFEKQEKELIEFKEGKRMKSKNISSKHIGDELLTLSSENPYSKDHFEIKSQAKCDKSDHSFEQK